MNQKLALCLVLLLALGVARAGATPEPLWQPVRPGVFYAAQELAAGSADQVHRLHWLRIDLQQADLELALSPQICSGMRLTDLDQDENVVASLNASFFTREFLTRGHSVSAGRSWEGNYRISEGPLLACGVERQCFVLHQPPPLAAPDWQDAASGVYSLLIGGVARSEAEDATCGAFCQTTHPRSAAGLDASRRWLFWLAVEGRQKQAVGLPLARLASLMQGVGVADAVNFDGGGSTGMHVLGQANALRPDEEPVPRRIANAFLLLQGAHSEARGKIAARCASALPAAGAR